MQGIEPTQLATDATTRDAIDKHIQTVNADLAQVETIKRFAILPEPFCLEKGEGIRHLEISKICPDL